MTSRFALKALNENPETLMLSVGVPQLEITGFPRTL